MESNKWVNLDSNASQQGDLETLTFLNPNFCLCIISIILDSIDSTSLGCNEVCQQMSPI